RLHPAQSVAPTRPRNQAHLEFLEIASRGSLPTSGAKSPSLLLSALTYTDLTTTRAIGLRSAICPSTRLVLLLCNRWWLQVFGDGPGAATKFADGRSSMKTVSCFVREDARV